jgi:hypothetical protein
MRRERIKLSQQVPSVSNGVHRRSIRSPVYLDPSTTFHTFNASGIPPRYLATTTNPYLELGSGLPRRMSHHFQTRQEFRNPTTSDPRSGDFGSDLIYITHYRGSWVLMNDTRFICTLICRRDGCWNVASVYSPVLLPTHLRYLDPSSTAIHDR